MRFVHYTNFYAVLSIWDIIYGFICYLETLQVLLLILCSLGDNIRGVTAKQMEEAVPIFDLSVPIRSFLWWTSLWHNRHKYLCCTATLCKVGNIDSMMMCTKTNGIFSPMRHSIQCHAIWWQKYRPIKRTSVLINTVNKCNDFQHWSVYYKTAL
jgi:hypothetical protein